MIEPTFGEWFQFFFFVVLPIAIALVFPFVMYVCDRKENKE